MLPSLPCLLQVAAAQADGDGGIAGSPLRRACRPLNKPHPLAMRAARGRGSCNLLRGSNAALCCLCWRCLLYRASSVHRLLSCHLLCLRFPLSWCQRSCWLGLHSRRSILRGLCHGHIRRLRLGGCLGLRSGSLVARLCPGRSCCRRRIGHRLCNRHTCCLLHGCHAVSGCCCCCSQRRGSSLRQCLCLHRCSLCHLGSGLHLLKHLLCGLHGMLFLSSAGVGLAQPRLELQKVDRVWHKAAAVACWCGRARRLWLHPLQLDTRLSEGEGNRGRGGRGWTGC